MRGRHSSFGSMSNDHDETDTHAAAQAQHETGQEAQAVAAARTLIAQYGEDAQVIAMMRVSELGFSGDIDGYAHWEMVLAAVEVLTSETPQRYDA